MGLHWTEIEWAYKVIEGRHCVGTAGNLDCLSDRLIEVNQWTYDGEEAKEIAKWIVEKHNEMVR